MILSEVALGCPIVTTYDMFSKFKNSYDEVVYEKYSEEVAPDEVEDYIRVRSDQADLWDSTIVTNGVGLNDGNATEYLTFGDDQQLPGALIFYERGRDDGQP